MTQFLPTEDGEFNGNHADDMDFAISVGEGTLLFYGSDDPMNMPDVPDEYIDVFTVIFGPPIGTGQ